MEKLKKAFYTGALLVGAVAGYNSVDLKYDEDYLKASSSLERTIEEESLIKNDKFDHLRVYETDVRDAVSLVNEKMNPLVPLDPTYVLAMIQVESGSRHDRNGAFRHDPLQVANPGDYGLQVVQNLEENMGLLSDSIGFGYIDDSTNVEKGTLFLVNKAMRTKPGVIESGEMRDYTVQSGDNASVIARKEGTTVETIRKYNPDLKINNIKPNDKIKIRDSYRSREIIGWDSWEKAIEEYNGGGDPNYLSKVKRFKSEITRSSI